MAMRKSTAIAQRLLIEYGKEAEKIYRQERADSTMVLHTSFVDAIAKQQADVQTILYVLELIRFEVLFQKYEQLFRGPADEPKLEKKAD